MSVENQRGGARTEKTGRKLSARPEERGAAWTRLSARREKDTVSARQKLTATKKKTVRKEIEKHLQTCRHRQPTA